MAKKQRIRFGLIGCGRISAKHIQAIASNNEAQLVALCDIEKNRAESKSNEYLGLVESKSKKPEIYENIDEMLELAKMDVLSICTPSGIHPEIGIKAAKKRINVITEKPMATNLKQADLLIKACEKAKVKLFVVKQNRLNPTIKLLKQSIDKKRFGKIYLILVNVLWSRPQSYYDEAAWRGTWLLDGGAFMNQASHYIDAMQWLAGPVQDIYAQTSTLARKIETEDTGSAVMKFQSGAIGNINVTMLTYPKNLEGSITIIGEKGTVRIGGIALNHIECWQFEKSDNDDKLVSKSNYEIESVYGSGHNDYYKNVTDVLMKGAEPNTDGLEGRKSLELISAIYKSSRTGKKVIIK